MDYAVGEAFAYGYTLRVLKPHNDLREALKTLDIFERSFGDAAAGLETFRRSPEALRACADFADLLADTYRRGGKALAAGNGGSHTDALHFAEELTGRFRRDRRPLPALALGESAHLTCVANDYGFEHVFSRMVEAFGGEDDLLILLSTSGNSPNLLRAAEAAMAKGMKVVGLLGRGGGELGPLCDLVVMAPGETSDRIQEIHMMVLHTAIEAAEAALGLDA